MKSITGIILIAVTLVISSCSMNWESGGNEEFRTHCEGRLEWDLADEYDSIDVDEICDCLLDKAKDDYDNYEDFLMNMGDFFDAYVLICASKN